MKNAKTIDYDELRAAVDKLEITIPTSKNDWEY